MEDKIKKEMLLRMIMRCNKVRKHKPKKVKDPVLEIGPYSSVDFSESGIKKKKWYSTSETENVRKSLLNMD